MPQARQSAPRVRATRSPRVKRPAPPGYIALADAAARLSVATNTARSYVRRGLLVGALIGGKTIVTSKSVDEFLAAGGLYAEGAA